jgi:glycosyltransferase involved in cell wall biosynthesis
VRAQKAGNAGGNESGDDDRPSGGPVVAVPTAVDVDRYRTPDAGVAPPRRVRIGWMGTPSTAPYLATIEAPLADLIRDRDVEIVLVGAGTSPFARVPATLVPWRLDDEVRDICSFDIGLMPMPDTPWTRGKAALKALQYSAAGVPTVGSWTETNAQILGTDDGALLCRSDDDWRQALRTLVDDAALRRSLGARARARVAARFSIDAQAPRLAAIIREPERA